jgi:hypothetical protein
MPFLAINTACTSQRTFFEDCIARRKIPLGKKLRQLSQTISWRERRRSWSPPCRSQMKLREYQQMIDKLNNTLSAALARGERRRRRR